jgi:hypothetical protein
MSPEYPNKYHCNINNNNIHGVKSTKCKKFKALLIFLINFLITDKLYDILINTVGYTILNNFLHYKKKEDSVFEKMHQFLKNHNLLYEKYNEKNPKYVLNKLKLFELDENKNTITINFQSISIFLIYIMMVFVQTLNSNKGNECNFCKIEKKCNTANQKKSNTTNDKNLNKINYNKTELFKVHFLVKIIILFCNHIYDNRENFTKISKKTFNDIKGWIMFIRYLPSCVQPGILKEECIKLIEDPSFKDFMGFTDIRKLLYFLPAFYTSCKKNKSTVNKIVNEFTTIKNKIWGSIGAQK